MNIDLTPPLLTNSSCSPDAENRISALTADALPYYNSIFKRLLQENKRNAMDLCDFITAEYVNQNIKPSTRLTHIKIICSFSKFIGYRDYQTVTKQDVINYLNSLRKTEAQDAGHKWMGTYNTRHMILQKFFRWLFNKGETDSEKWITPPCINGIKPMRRVEKSPYKPSDIWTAEDHSLFLKYCPEKRDACYHAMANDTSCRPHELLSLRIRDIIFKLSLTGKQYAEVNISESKTRPRTLPLIFSIPYVKDWIDCHPNGNNPNAFLFVSLSDTNYGTQLSQNALYKQYTRKYKKSYFPKLVTEDSSTPDSDKSYLKNLLTKPWNPYIIRHSALTAKSQILKESTLRDHAGWSTTSKMPSIYIHYFGNESAKTLLEAYGIESYQKYQIDLLKTKTCPNCNEPNKNESKFCAKCRMVLSYGAYSEVKDEKESEIKGLKDKYATMESKFDQILSMIQQNPELALIKPEALKKKAVHKIAV